MRIGWFTLAAPLLVAASLALGAGLGAAVDVKRPLDRDAEQWVSTTMRAMTPDEKVGQLLTSSFESMFTSVDSDTYERLAERVQRYHVGGFVLFGGSKRAPQVQLNPTYGTVTLGDPHAAAALSNRLQQLSKTPLMNAADFEAGVGFRIEGATVFPRAMAFGAANDERLTYEAARITAVEARAVGVQVNFAPVVDINNNPRNPVINIRSFGESPERVGALGASYVRGLQDGGALATLKHFPGHGDTDVDSHLGLPIITRPRERLEAMEFAPFRAGITAGAAALMSAHIEMPSLDPTPSSPATLSRRITTGLVRGEMQFDGVIYTDSMSMKAITQMLSPGQAAVRAIQAGADIVLHSPDDGAAFEAISSAVQRGEITSAQLDAAVTRILRAKARLGLHKARLVDMGAVAESVGGRAHQAIADEVSARSITLIRDERKFAPLNAPRDAQVLYLSVLDYPGGWEIAAPSRTFIPELKKRWPNVTAIEISDRTAPADLDLVRASARRYDAIIASVFVRASSGSGRMDLSPGPARLLQDLARGAPRETPFVAVLFGNPYTALALPDVPTVFLTYDFYDRAEASAVRALAGEAPVRGRLPIALPGLFPVGHGLDRAPLSPSAQR